MPDSIRTVRNKPHWLNKNCKRACNRKSRLFKVYLKHKSPANFAKYKEAEKECTRTVRNARKRFEKRLANKNDKRRFSSYVKSRTANKETVGPLKIDGIMVHDDSVICEELNTFFSSVFTREDVSYMPNFENVHNGSTIENLHITPDMITKEVAKLSSSSSCGPGGYTNRFLKDFCHVLANPLSMVFNELLTTNTVPDSWKLAHVIPIFKKGSKGDPGNYRPVSLTCVVGKLFERLIKRVICEHLEVNNLLSNAQHGFREGRSCTTNLLEFFENVTRAVDSGSPYDVIYYDFSKAFDKVPRERLLLKLSAYGIRGKLLNWIRNWLTGRYQATSLNGKLSAWLEVLSGVPQGSVLGPILFIIFINDIYNCADGINCIKIFADDAKMGNKVDTTEGQISLQRCIDKMYEWSTEWQMEFNAKKCKIIHIGNNNPHFNYTLNGHTLVAEERETDVGVIVTPNMKPSNHCRKAALTANGVLSQVTRSFHFRDRNIFLKIYKMYVRPHLEFASPAWSPWLEGDIEILENVQKRFVKMVSGLHGTTYGEKLKELRILSLRNRRLYFDLVETFKCIRGYSKVDYRQWFLLEKDLERRNTRARESPLNILPPRARLDMRKNFFSHRVVQRWNSLPDDMKENLSLDSFKNKLKFMLLESESPESQW